MSSGNVMAADDLRRREEWIRLALLCMAFSSILVLAMIILFVFREGVPQIVRVGIPEFLGGGRWAPTKGVFGIFPMIVGTIQVTLGALVIGVPLSLLSAICLSEFAAPRVRMVMKPLIELLSAIPSVVYGFIGVTVIVPLVRDTLGGSGFSVLSAALMLSVMILPTVTSIAYDALRAVPAAYREGALALGATPWQTVTRVVVPAARSGLVTAVILGMGRAMGETMAVIMVAGNAVVVPTSPLHPCRTLTSNIALEMAYASGGHQKALFATGVVLFVMIFCLNSIATFIARRR
ncbi:MAG TPA: phosphate ABC transporter permease subunit PstC [Candidatus Ozemobacteraceae bacterium]|nr:phosphate ABC transporter permease subunit PstC [Candidatus Ozemobacteraceae bacterium]HQG29130.1 phosphate ABC transporter permease subunit PstC [Candidatus Ozemobacteraceae bacterium]